MFQEITTEQCKNYFLNALHIISSTLQEIRNNKNIFICISAKVITEFSYSFIFLTIKEYLVEEDDCHIRYILQTLIKKVSCFMINTSFQLDTYTLNCN